MYGSASPSAKKKEKSMKLSSTLLPLLHSIIMFGLLVEVAYAQKTITRWCVLVSGTNDPAVISSQRDTQYMYHILVDHMGIGEDRVYYLHVDTSYRGVDALASKANVRWAIENWLRSHAQQPDIVFICFVSHGAQGIDGG
jgi:hypothetical protein